MAEYNHINSQATGAFLKKTLLGLMPEAGSFETGIPGLRITRQNEPTKSDNCFYIPMIVVMVQGSKQVFFGSEEFIYSENQCLVTGLDLPAVISIIKARPDKPSLAISLKLDTHSITDLLAEIPQAKIESEGDDFAHRGMAVTDVDPYVLDAFLRLAELINDTERQKVLAPLIIREVYYRLLMGPLGNQLRLINTIGSKSNQIAQAIAWLKTNYNKPVNIENLAKMTNMAPSTFNRYFRHLTNISPLQYQKRLRLYEAQRLMLIENRNAANAALSVGYESPTQFNREYKRMFGEPPLENKKRILTG
ncbi:MAG: AraC family transcriptional regulator [Treponema sp.]|jgi:AraC-like DNA-binding protein|nr:AraC family transcriptional regulator [Treponema sp.]